jgi:hypothetical protein
LCGTASAMLRFFLEMFGTGLLRLPHQHRGMGHRVKMQGGIDHGRHRH